MNKVERMRHTIYLASRALQVEARDSRVFLTFVEASDGGSTKYDWRNGINFALNATEIGKILRALRKGNEVKLIHSPQGTLGDQQTDRSKLKTLTLNYDSEKQTYNLVCATANRRIYIPISPEEAIVLDIFLQHALVTLFKGSDGHDEGRRSRSNQSKGS